VRAKKISHRLRRGMALLSERGSEGKLLLPILPTGGRMGKVQMRAPERVLL